MGTVCKLLILCAGVTFGAAGARAEEATPQVADRLTATLQTYLGKVPGVVAVAAAGGRYEVTLDMLPLAERVLAGAGRAEATPLVLALTDRGDGTWDVALDQAFGLTLDVPGETNVVIGIDQVRMSGVFDESLRAMRQSVADLSGIAITQTVPVPDEGQMVSRQTIAAAHLETEAVAAAAGGVDLTSATVMTDLLQVQTLPMSADAAPMEIGFATGRYAADSAMTGLRTDALLDVLAWLVAHPSRADIAAEQDGLRRVLTAALPLLEGARSTGEFSDLSVQTPVGTIALRRATTASEASGIVADAHLATSGTMEGLVLPPGLVPGWSEGLVPQDLTLAVEVTGVDLAGPAAILIGAFDLTRPEPFDGSVTDPLLAALLPTGMAQVALAPGTLTAPLFQLGYDGDLAVGPGAMPVGQATVTLQGHDKAVAALEQAPAPDVAQLLQMLGVARGLAQQDGDLLTWAFSLPGDGRVLLNGMDLAAFPGVAP
jgi:hypothetical protein